MLRLVKSELVPVSKNLCLEFRDMAPVPGERELLPRRARAHVGLLVRENFFTPIWGTCRCRGRVYRGNGNHTSHVLAACCQAHNGGLDDKSKFLLDNVINKVRGVPRFEETDLPEVKDGDFSVLIERFECDSESELTTFFERYDSKVSTRSSGDVLNIYKNESRILSDLPTPAVKHALNGVVAVAKAELEAFGIPSGTNLNVAAEIPKLLRIEEVADVVSWMVVNVPIEKLYSTVPGAKLCAETYLQYGPEKAAEIFERLADQIDADEEWGSSYFSALTKQRNRPTAASITGKGRKAINRIVRDMNE